MTTKELKLETLNQLKGYVENDAIISWEWDRKTKGQYRIEIIIDTTKKANPVDAVVSPLADDGKPFDFVGDDGTVYIMAACGHRVGSKRFTIGVSKEALCPNCNFMIRLSGKIPIVYRDRLPENINEAG